MKENAEYFDSQEFKEKYLTDAELGALYTASRTVFRLWAPTAEDVGVILYSDGGVSAPLKIIPMRRSKTAAGVWEAAGDGDLHGTYYQYRVSVHGTVRDSADPYARACGVNGIRSMIVNLRRTDPEGWDSVTAPAVRSPCDAVVYEAHVADITSSPFWNGSAALRRTYSGAAEKGTSYGGVPTGFDHIRSLGITHVQLLPVFDFKTVDETRLHDSGYALRTTDGLFNWGYDPENYGAPEGSYSSDPAHGEVRIRELKSLIKAFAEAGIGVIMDVVFNHVKDGPDQALGMCVPGYYFRAESFSGAGDDTASEREMFRKYMIDMLCYWLREYKLCGFRFDLMGLHDVETMNAARDALRKIKKDVLIYGEGWDMYRAGKMTAASMLNARLMPEIGFFNDAFRCAVKGSVFCDTAPGFIHDGSRREALKFGIVGATAHPQVDNEKVDGTANPRPWGDYTWISVNYTEIHDNLTLHDKLELVEPRRPEKYYDQMQKTATALVLLAEGLPVLHAGMEFLRTKEIPAGLLSGGQQIPDLAWTAAAETDCGSGAANADCAGKSGAGAGESAAVAGESGAGAGGSAANADCGNAAVVDGGNAAVAGGGSVGAGGNAANADGGSAAVADDESVGADKRRKAFSRNSYNLCDKVNALDWSRCADKKEVVAYVRALIALRKAHPAFRIADGRLLARALRFLDNAACALPEEALAWEIDGTQCGDSWRRILVAVNPRTDSAQLRLPENGRWHLITDGERFADSAAAGFTETESAANIVNAGGTETAAPPDSDCADKSAANADAAAPAPTKAADVIAAGGVFSGGAAVFIKPKAAAVFADF